MQSVDCSVSQQSSRTSGRSNGACQTGICSGASVALDPDTYYPGDTVTYVVTVRAGLIPLVGLRISSTNQTPGQYTSVTSTPAARNIVRSDQSFTASYPLVLPLTTITLTAIFKISDSAAPRSYDNVFTIDGTNVARQTIVKTITVVARPPPPSASLAVTLKTDQDFYGPRSFINFTGTITNTSAVTAQNVVLNFTSSATGGFTLAPCGPTSNAFLTCPIGNLSPGQVYNYVIQQETDGPAEDSTKFANMTATADNAPIAFAQVNFLIRTIIIVKRAFTSTVSPGQSLDYSIYVGNGSSFDRNGFKVSDTNALPGQFTNVVATRGSITNLVISGNSFTADLGTLRAEDSRAVEMIATFVVATEAQPGSYINTVTLVDPTIVPLDSRVSVTVV